MKSALVFLVLFGLVTACNDNKTEGSEEATEHDMQSMEPNPNDPPMPEIPADAKVYFGNLIDGQEVSSPFEVEMRVTDLSVDTANGILKPASGHHHILVDIDSIPTKEVIMKDSVHIHFGNAQTSAELSLPPGEHKLTLQFADAMHRSYGSRLTSSVTVNVKN